MGPHTNTATVKSHHSGEGGTHINGTAPVYLICSRPNMDGIDFKACHNSKATTPAFQCCEEIRVLVRAGGSDEPAICQNHVEGAKSIAGPALRRG
jgi:hypothetical protein